MKFSRKWLMLMSIILVAFTISACENKPLKIGFIGSLTTKNSQLSIDARNAVELGVEQINENGGINGQKIQLIIKDDVADIEIAKQKHDEFKSEDVNLVIGHMTSNMSEAILASQGEDLLFLSPSMSTDSLSGKDDYFLCTSPLNKNQALTFLDLIDDLNVSNAIILYDLMNAEYTENMAKNAVALNKTMGNINLTLVPFDSRTDDLEKVSERVLGQDSTEVVLMISQSIDTAYLSQKLKSQKPDLVLVSVSWSMTEDLMINGGSAVEGMYFIGVYKAESPTEQYTQFQKDFYEKYQYEASFVSVLAYDAFQLMIDAVEETQSDKPSLVKKYILNVGTVNGLEENFNMDVYGDNNRSYLIYQLINDVFMPKFN